MERAEKRFLLAFLSGIVGGSIILSAELWGLNVGELAALPVARLVNIVLSTAILATSVLAVLAYLTIGLVIQRAVEIHPREGE
jgi:hypothetical protein